MAGLVLALTRPEPVVAQEPSPAAQQAPGANGLEEITVTARRREESIQDIPLSVTAFTSEDLTRRGAIDMNDIATLTPGFNFQDFGGFGSTSPTIRGLTQIAGTTNSEQNVSFFVDGVYLPRSYMTNLGLDGVERVEIVEGPQSARYGFNAFMGAVNYISMKPTDEWHAEVDGTAGIYSRYDAKGVVSGPIVPGKIDFLLGAAYSTFAGSWVNPDPDCDIHFSTGTDCRSGGWRKTTYNAALRFTPVEDLVIDASAFHWKRDFEQGADGWFGELNANSEINNCGQYNPNVRPLAAGGIGAGGQWYRLYCGQLPLVDSPIDPRAYGSQLSSTLIRGSVNWTINERLKAEYIYGHTAATNIGSEVSDSTPACLWAFPGLCAFNFVGPDGSSTEDSHQFRLTYDDSRMVRAEVGLSYAQARDLELIQFGLAPTLTGPPTTPLLPIAAEFPALFINLAANYVKDTITSPFGELTLSFLDKRLRVGAEVRWTDDQKTQYGLAAGGQFLEVQTGSSYATSFRSLTPRYTVEYDLAKDHMVYASAAKGEKAGGFNTTAHAVQFETFAPDTNWTYEVGSKNTFGNFRINADVFYVTWKNMQISASDPSNPAPIPNVITLNLGDMTSTGVELQGAWAPTEHFLFDFSGYYGDPKYSSGTRDLNIARVPPICDNIVCAENGDISGKTPPRASKASATLGAEFHGNSIGGMDLKYYVRPEVTGQSKAYVDEDDLAWIGARALVNLTLGVTGSHYDVQLWCRNLLDKIYVTSALVEAPNVNYYEALGDRRTAGVTARFKY
jgi:iron complex outermembrane receptor protein